MVPDANDVAQDRLHALRNQRYKLQAKGRDASQITRQIEQLQKEARRNFGVTKVAPGASASGLAAKERLRA